MLQGPLSPFIKWPGGKRWASRRIGELISVHLLGTYFEPFLGGGAVFFHVLPRRAILSDINEELIGVYRAIRANPEPVIRELSSKAVTKTNYYRVRAGEPQSASGKAARFLYLNRTAFGGIYRLNLDGKFNVPYGGGARTPEMLWKTDALNLASTALQRATLKVSDFEPVIESAKSGDVVYCDPTYTVAHDNNGFIRYNERNFSWSDQERLADAAFRAASDRGVLVLISNAHHHSIKKLYRGASFETLSRMSAVTPHADQRRYVKELLIRVTPT
jgi:DNA adenine methylase